MISANSTYIIGADSVEFFELLRIRSIVREAAFPATLREGSSSLADQRCKKFVAFI
jgi:hypothetical protein